MKFNKLKELLSKYNNTDVEKYVEYCRKLENDPKNKNPWMRNKTAEMLAQYFKEVDSIGLVLDGIHVTLQYSGVFFDYVAYKKKMLKIYPETVMDVSIVYENDVFSFSKKNGKVLYSHDFGDPFKQIDKNIIGAYCVIINKRGEFLTLLSALELEKHRKSAKTDYIWQNWYREMCLKTISKKACKQHFNDDFTDINKIDNENSDVNKSVEISIEMKTEIEKIKSIDELNEFYKKNKDNVENLSDFHKELTIKKEKLCNAKKEQEKNDNLIKKEHDKIDYLIKKVSTISDINVLRDFYEREKANYDDERFKEIMIKRSKTLKAELNENI